MGKTFYTGKNEGSNMDTWKWVKFNKLPFTSVFLLFSDFWKRYNCCLLTVAENINSSDHVYSS